MSSETTIVVAQYRLHEWEEQRSGTNRPASMRVADWCVCNGITKASYYYRLRHVSFGLHAQLYSHGVPAGYNWGCVFHGQFANA